MADPRLSDFDFLEALQFRPKIWWDPVPPWLRDQLKGDVLRRIAVIQLEKQMKISEIEQAAMGQTLEALKAIQG